MGRIAPSPLRSGSVQRLLQPLRERAVDAVHGLDVADAGVTQAPERLEPISDRADLGRAEPGDPALLQRADEPLALQLLADPVGVAGVEPLLLEPAEQAGPLVVAPAIGVLVDEAAQLALQAVASA